MSNIERHADRAQLVAPPGGEGLLLSVAKQLESLRPWPRHAPLAGVDSTPPLVRIGLALDSKIASQALCMYPRTLVEQWQDELIDKFGLSFTILTQELAAASQGGNPFPERPLLIARLDGLSRSESLQAESEWDRAGGQSLRPIAVIT